jgi:hypothetical protein
MPVNKRYKQILNELIGKHGITVIKWSMHGDISEDWAGKRRYWWAEIDDREVVIPRPDTSHRFMIALHEIGHCVRGERKYLHREEYVAEKWAIDTAKSYGIKCNRYEKNAAKWVLRCIKSDIANNYITEDNVSTPIKKWIKKILGKYEV